MVSSKSIFTLRAEGGGLREVREIFPSKSSIIYVREGIDTFPFRYVLKMMLPLIHFNFAIEKMNVSVFKQ